jgi:hypothetical protein
MSPCRRKCNAIRIPEPCDHSFVWTLYDISSLANNTATIGYSPTPFNDGGSFSVYATATNGHLYVYERTPSTFVWTLYDVTYLASGSVDLDGDPAPIPDPLGGLDVYANGVGGQMFAFARNASTYVWSTYNITSLS